MHAQYTVKIASGEEVALCSQAELSGKVQGFQRDHYQLSCWKRSGEEFLSLDGTICADVDTTLTAVWRGQEYSVKLNKNGGSCSDLTAYRHQEGAVLPTDWTLAGSTFEGWKDNAALTGESVAQIAASEYGDREFWAKGVKKKIAIVYDTNYDASQTVDS